MNAFNQAAQGVSPAQSRAVFKAARQQTMVERQQIVPVLKPHGMGESDVDRAAYRTQLQDEHKQARAINMRAQQLYQTRACDIQARVTERGRTRNNFNQNAAQAWDMQEISL